MQQLIFSFAHDTPTYVWNSGIDSNTGKILNGNGNFSFQIFGNSLKTVPMPSGTTISVEVKDNTDNDKSCEAELRNGDITVPSVMNLLTPSTFGKEDNSIVSYMVRLRECAQDDDVKIITSVPSGKTQQSWLEIK